MRKLTLLVGLFIVSCAAHADRKQYTDCYRLLPSMPEVAPLIGKVAMTGDELQALRFLGNQERVTTAAERRALEAYTDTRKLCDGYLTIQDEELSAALRRRADGIRSAAAELYAGKMTFGEFNQELVRLNNELNDFQRSLMAAREARAQQLQRQILEAQRQDEARRQALGLQLLKNMQQQQQNSQLVPYQIPTQKQSTTNCVNYGNQVQCTTR